MKTVKLGNSDLSVSRVCFGTWQFGGDWGDITEADAIRVIHAARGAGITVFDTAQAYGYGTSETVLGKALKQLSAADRAGVAISTKGGLRPGDPSARGRDASAPWMRTCLERSLQLLGVEQIDLYYVHWPDPKVPMAETAGFMRTAIDEGLIAHAGVSNFTIPEMEAFAEICPITSIQPPYHMLRRTIERDLLPFVRAQGIGCMVYSPLASGLLSGRMTADTTFDASDWRSQSSAFRGDGFSRNIASIEKLRAIADGCGISLSQLAIAWALARPGVDVVVTGARSVANAVGGAAAGDVDLDEDTMVRIETILADTEPVGGISPEGIA